MFEVSREIAGLEKRKSTDLVSNRCHHKRNSNPAQRSNRMKSKKKLKSKITRF